MAKKTPASSKPTPAPKKTPAKATTSTETGALGFSTDDIGYAAGGIWLALQDGDELTLAALKKATGLGPDLTMAAVGWLAREGKLNFSTSGRTAKVSWRTD